MERERRTVSLAAISLLMYGFVSVMGNGPFAFFPVNELVFFGIVVYFSFFHFKTAKVSYLVMLLLGTMDLLNNQIFLSFFMNNEQLGQFYSTEWLKYVRLGAYVLILAEITRFFVLTKWKIFAFAYPLVLIAIIAGVWLHLYVLQTAGLVIFVALLYYAWRKQTEGIAVYSKSLFYLWYFLTFLKLTTLLTIYLYDLKLG